MVKLALHVLQHEDSLEELTVLAKRLIDNLAADKVSALLPCPILTTWQR